MSSAGDVNRDGYADVIVSNDSTGGTGAAYVFLGSASGIGDRTTSGAHVRLKTDQEGALAMRPTRRVSGPLRSITRSGLLR